VPPPISSNAVQLQQELDTLISSGKEQFVIPPGVYTFSNSSLILTGARNKTIIATGVTFVFYYGFGLMITGCHYVTVEGLLFDSEPPNYAQGLVTSIVNETSFVARFDERFIPPDTREGPFSGPKTKVTLWDPKTKRILQKSLNFMVASTESAEGEYQITVAHPMKVFPTEGVTPITVIPRRGFTWHALNSSQIVADGVTIHAGGGFANLLFKYGKYGKST